MSPPIGKKDIMIILSLYLSEFLHSGSFHAYLLVPSDVKHSWRICLRNTAITILETKIGIQGMGIMKLNISKWNWLKNLRGLAVVAKSCLILGSSLF